MNRLRLAFWGSVDLFYRIRNYLRRKWTGIGTFSNRDDTSDSSATFYVKAVDKILSRHASFAKFRRIYDYKEILEHVSYTQGLAYIERILQLEPELMQNFAIFKSNDLIGKPVKYSFPNIGLVSPTTIRYVSVLAEIREIFGHNFQGNIAEIGVGYGGQFLAIEKSLKCNSYSMFDLPNVLNLVEIFLANFEKEEKLIFESLDNQDLQEWDLVISNYAFSELPRPLQLKYIEKVLSRSKRGYLIMNSGRSDSTGRSLGKLSVGELKELLPPFKILEEIPLTSEDNYVIVWGHER